MTMGNCPVCGRYTSSAKCCDFCGFDDSCNYEAHRTLEPVPASVRSLDGMRLDYKQKHQNRLAYVNITAQQLFISANTAHSDEERVRKLEQSALLGYAPAQCALGKYYFSSGSGLEKDAVKAVEWLWKAADQNDKDAKYWLGLCYQVGIGVRQSDTDAVRWFRLAAEQEHPEAQYHLAKCYASGRGVRSSKKTAAFWYRRSAARGNVSAQICMGDCCLTGSGVEQDAPQAAEWYRRAAKQGHPAGLYYLGICYKNGTFVKRDKVKAIDLLNEAATFGSAPAKEALKYLYSSSK